MPLFWISDLVGIAEVPGQTVEVAEHVAAGAGAVAAARRERRIVEEGPALDDACRFGIVHPNLRELDSPFGIHNRDGIVEPRQHVKTIVLLVERQTGRPAA